jgi:hypothetical protein
VAHRPRGHEHRDRNAGQLVVPRRDLRAAARPQHHQHGRAGELGVWVRVHGTLGSVLFIFACEVISRRKMCTLCFSRTRFRFGLRSCRVRRLEGAPGWTDQVPLRQVQNQNRRFL